MKALILCAGLGTRLGLRKTPKCMVKVKGKPVLEHLVNHLNKAGITKIIVNIHKDYDKIFKYFGTRLLYLYEPVPMGEFATVSLIKAWFPGEDILVANGDTLIEDNIKLDFYPPEFRHNGLTLYQGNNRKIFRTNFIDIGTPKGLAEARKKYG